MTKDTKPARSSTRGTWETPEFRRLEASEAEAAGAIGNDGVIGS